jgi:hypothetical protein
MYFNYVVLWSNQGQSEFENVSPGNLSGNSSYISLYITDEQSSFLYLQQNWLYEILLVATKRLFLTVELGISISSQITLHI